MADRAEEDGLVYRCLLCGNTAAADRAELMRKLMEKDYTELACRICREGQKRPSDEQCGRVSEAVKAYERDKAARNIEHDREREAVARLRPARAKGARVHRPWGKRQHRHLRKVRDRACSEAE